MDQKRKEVNHEINMRYRQLGKKLYDDLKKDHLNVSHYKKEMRKIDGLVKLTILLDVKMEGVDEPICPDVQDVEPKTMTNDEGVTIYRFCSQCQAGNHPEATNCVRCGAVLE